MAIRTTKNPIAIVIVMLIAGLYLFITNVGDVTRLQSAPTNFNSMVKTDFKEGDIVEGTAYYCIGCVAEEYTERNGVRYGTGSTSLYYVIPAGEAEYVVIQVRSGLYDSLDRLTDQTMEFATSGTAPTASVHFKGTVSKTDSQVEDWMYEYLEYFFGASSASEVAPYIINYTIDCKDYDTVYAMFWLGLGLIVLSAIIIVVAILLGKTRRIHAVPQSTFEPENAYARGASADNNFDWNNTVPAPSQNANVGYTVAPPPAPNSDIMASVVVPQNAVPNAAPVQPAYGGYSAPVNGAAPASNATTSQAAPTYGGYTTPASSTASAKPTVTGISSSQTAPEVIDAFADLQNDAMQSFADLSKESKASFNDVNPKQ